MDVLFFKYDLKLGERLEREWFLNKLSWAIQDNKTWCVRTYSYWNLGFKKTGLIAKLLLFAFRFDTSYI